MVINKLIKFINSLSKEKSEIITNINKTIENQKPLVVSNLVKNMQKAGTEFEVKMADTDKDSATKSQESDIDKTRIAFSNFLDHKLKTLKIDEKSKVELTPLEKLNNNYSDKRLSDFIDNQLESKYVTIEMKKDPVKSLEFKEKMLKELIAFREALKNFNDPNSLILIKKNIEFYHTDNKLNAEDRGNFFHITSEMYVDYSRVNGNYIASAEQLVSNLKSIDNDNVKIHSSLKQPNKDSYKHAHEIINAKKFSSQMGGLEVFVTGDCKKDDPELLSFIGDSALIDEKSEKQTNFDLYYKITQNGDLVVKRVDIKMKALSQAAVAVVSNDTADIIRSVGTLDIHQKLKLNAEVKQKAKDKFNKKIIVLEKELDTVSEEEKKIKQTEILFYKEQIAKVDESENLNTWMHIINVEKILHNSGIEIKNNEPSSTDIVD